MQKPEQVLVRLKVEHSGFTTLNGQRFGAMFVDEVANPSDILLFHRKKQTAGSPTKRNTSNVSALSEPIVPEDLAEVNVEDLILNNLHSKDRRLEILDEAALGVALEAYVNKKNNHAISETTEETMHKQQKSLLKRGKREDESGGMITTAARVREVCASEAEKIRQRAENGTVTQPSQEDDGDGDGDQDIDGAPSDSDESAMKPPAPTKKSARKRPAPASTRRPDARKSRYADSSEEEDAPAPRAATAPPKRRPPPKRTARSQPVYNVLDSSASESEILDESAASTTQDLDASQATAAGRRGGTAARTARGGRTAREAKSQGTWQGARTQSQGTPLRQSQLTFAAVPSTRSPAIRRTARGRRTAATATYTQEDSDDAVEESPLPPRSRRGRR
mmetsp:Transcript_12362/g.27094  ORF Transcript_12362/g.27094 Transcript_12362/m.27094 type:complete len:392 (-) Transcript_12362:133-1308(-)